MTDARKIEAIAKAVWDDRHPTWDWPPNVDGYPAVYLDIGRKALRALQELEEMQQMGEGHD